MTFDYRLNSDLLGYGNQTGTPRNAVLEVSFSDVQSVNGNPGGLLVLTYTATEEVTGFQDDNLIDATITNLSRDGLTYTPVLEFSVLAKKEFTFDDTTGTIAFHTGLPPLEIGEDVVIEYVPEGSFPIGATEPVTLSEGKAWLKVEVDDDDPIIDALITASRQMCEGFTGLSFVERTVTAILRNDLGNIRLPYSPVGTITSVSDENDNAVSYTATGANVKRIATPWACYLKVIYTAGYSSLPQNLKTGVLMQLAWLYEHRGDVDAATMSPQAMIVLKPFRIVV